MRLSLIKSAIKDAFLFCAAVMGMLLLPFTAQGQKPAEYVNPFIGTSNYGATFPGPVVPWGMVSVVPYNVTPGRAMSIPIPIAGAPTRMCTIMN